MIIISTKVFWNVTYGFTMTIQPLTRVNRERLELTMEFIISYATQSIGQSLKFNSLFNPGTPNMSIFCQGEINFNKLRKLQGLSNWDLVTFQVIYKAIILQNLNTCKARINDLAHITLEMVCFVTAFLN